MPPTDPTPIPAEPPTGTMLLALDPTPGYEGVVVGVWHRRDDGAWVDGEHRWFSSYCRRMPDEPYTWAEAVARGAMPDRPLIEVAAGLTAGRTAAAADIRARIAEVDAKIGDVAPVVGQCLALHATGLAEAALIAAEGGAARIAENGANHAR